MVHGFVSSFSVLNVDVTIAVGVQESENNLRLVWIDVKSTEVGLDLKTATAMLLDEVWTSHSFAVSL